MNVTYLVRYCCGLRGLLNEDKMAYQIYMKGHCPNIIIRKKMALKRKAVHAHTALEIFAGEEVIEKWRIGYNARRDAINRVSTTNLIYFTTTASTGQTCRHASHLIHNSELITCFS